MAFLGFDMVMDDYTCKEDGVEDEKNKKVVEDNLTKAGGEAKASGETKESGETKAGEGTKASEETKVVGKAKRKSTVEKGLEAVFDKFKMAASEDFERYIITYKMNILHFSFTALLRFWYSTLTNSTESKGHRTTCTSG